MRAMVRVAVAVAGMAVASWTAQAQQGANAVTAPAAAAQVAAAAAGSAANGQQVEIVRMKAQLEDWANLARYRAADLALPEREAGRVVFYGDSITDIWHIAQSFPGKPYVNRGISGQTTPQMLVRFRQDVVNLHPAVVLILAGTNDLVGNTGPSTLAMIEDNYQSMAEIAKASGIKVIVASVTPVAKYPWRPELVDPAAKIETLNAWIKGYCERTGATYLDYWTAMAGPDGGMKPGISIEGVHPNAAGFAIMAPLAEAAIERTMSAESATSAESTDAAK